MATRIKSLIGPCSGREASCARREVLKSVAQAVPTYSMIELLSSLQDNLQEDEIGNSKLLVRKLADSWHIHELRWERLIQHKSVGGMGFRDLHLFNKAMLGKQGWGLVTRPKSLYARVLKGRYYHDGDFMGDIRRKHSSHTWRAILDRKEVLGSGMIKWIGNGASTNIWRDQWIHLHFDARPITLGNGQEISLVSELMTASGHWNKEIIRDTFLPIDVEAILRIPIKAQDEV